MGNLISSEINEEIIEYNGEDNSEENLFMRRWNATTEEEAQKKYHKYYKLVRFMIFYIILIVMSIG